MITSCVRQKIRDLFVDGVDVCAVSAKQFNNLSLRGAQRRSTSDGQVKRSFQLVVSGIDQRSVIQQQLNHLQISGLAGEVQCASSSSKASATCVAAFDEAVVVMAWNFGVVVRSRPILHTHTHTRNQPTVRLGLVPAHTTNTSLCGHWSLSIAPMSVISRGTRAYAVPIVEKLPERMGTASHC